MDAQWQTEVRLRLRKLYGTRAEACYAELRGMLERFGDDQRFDDQHPSGARWSEQDIVLIAYGDQLRSTEATPLATLARFLREHQLQQEISTIHLLPFFPSTSDDGFAVVDYGRVDPAIGTWDDIASLDQDFGLMFDAVLNHTSQSSTWFQQFLAGDPEYQEAYLALDPATDVSQVVRPRSHALLTPFASDSGERHVWTTFSEDQVDLNYGDPQVLIRMVGVLLDYVARGATIVRLDAVAFLWKQIGTPCIHLEETHEVVKLLRNVLDAVAPHVILLTETNVPHQENISYFGGGDEAHMVYQFSLPPLMLDAMLQADARVLRSWLATVSESPPGTTYLNFTASHDGVGVRPLEDLVPVERRDQLVEAVLQRGGQVSQRRLADGSTVPYELNISYVDAVTGEPHESPEIQAARFLCTQTVMLSLKGIPAVYFHSLVGSQNDAAGAAESGIARRINRRKFTVAELNAMLRRSDGLANRIFSGYRARMATRIRQPAFHPDGAQLVEQDLPPSLLALERISPDGEQRIQVVANLGPHPVTYQYRGSATESVCDLLAPSARFTAGEVRLQPYQVAWLQVLPESEPLSAVPTAAER